MERQRTPVRSYQDLEAWQRAMDLVECYDVSRTFPSEERYGLTAQLRKSAASIPSNIAEGKGRRGLGGLLYHLSVANGSAMELETQLLIAMRLGYITGTPGESLVKRLSQVRQLLAGLIRALRASRRPG